MRILQKIVNFYCKLICLSGKHFYNDWKPDFDNSPDKNVKGIVRDCKECGYEEKNFLYEQCISTGKYYPYEFKH